jgi:flavodoxin
MIKVKKVLAPSASPGKGGKNELREPKSESGITSGTEGKKILIAYFSHSGNTRVIANQIHESVGGDIFEIVTVNRYPGDYDEVVEQARKELREEYTPELKTKVENMESYNVVFVGYPNWWGTMPRPIATFLSAYDFSGKTIAPFCTHEGSGLGRSATDIKELCPQSTILDGLAVRGRDVKKAQKEVSEWLRKKAV